MSGTAIILILILCSPLILGPLIIPTGKRLKARRAIARMRGNPKKGERLPDGLEIGELRRPTDSGRALPVCCDVQLDANLTKVECGGRIHYVNERIGPSELPGFQRLATLCFACGRLEKTGRTPIILDPRLFAAATDSKALEEAVIDARRRQRHKELAAARSA